MRDLDIRGAGNILGAEQSGFISEIGYEMYQKILDEALLELKEHDFKELFTDSSRREFVHDCVIETDLEILIPDSYITNTTERLSLYKELDSISDDQNLIDFRDRLADRFGPIPGQTEDLIHTIRLRWLAKKIGFEKLVLRNQRLIAYFVSNPESDYYQSLQFASILEYLKTTYQAGKMKEERGKLFMTFPGVLSISDALVVLEPLSVLKTGVAP
jgi:transcription-repair coupling factor (superfamily II helicase)